MLVVVVIIGVVVVMFVFIVVLVVIIVVVSWRKTDKIKTLEEKKWGDLRGHPFVLSSCCCHRCCCCCHGTWHGCATLAAGTVAAPAAFVAAGNG